MMQRRVLLTRGLATLGAMRCLGCNRQPDQSQPPSPPQTQPAVLNWLPIETKVAIPLVALETPWVPVPFTVYCSPRNGKDAVVQRIKLKGLALRIPTEPPSASDAPLRAFCTTCPHELCEVKLVGHRRHVPMDKGKRPAHPVFVCPCHLSVYDPLNGGAVISGPAPRGAFRFASHIDGGHLEITGVEEEVTRIT